MMMMPPQSPRARLPAGWSLVMTTGWSAVPSTFSLPPCETIRVPVLQLSPITHIDKVSAPLLLIQGANDPRVPVGEAIQMHAALEKRGAATKMIVFPDEGHGAQKRENKVLEIGHTLAWFELHLKRR